MSAPSPLQAFTSRFRPFFLSAAAFSLVINLLMLVPALFMLQVFDRVLTRRSVETLIMLLLFSLGALIVMAYLDIIRARLMTAAAVFLEHVAQGVLVEPHRRPVPLQLAAGQAPEPEPAVEERHARFRNDLQVHSPAVPLDDGLHLPAGRALADDPRQVTGAAHPFAVELDDGAHAPAAEAEEDLARIVREGADRGGAILVPAFALGRTQELLWMLQDLEDAGRIPSLPVYVDSPLAIEVTELYGRHPEDHDAEMRERVRDNGLDWQGKRVQLVHSPEESKALNRLRGPVIIISASGMATGGRILHHLVQRLPDARTTVMLVGFQAVGTRGRALKEGATTLRMFGEEVPVRAAVTLRLRASSRRR